MHIYWPTKVSIPASTIRNPARYTRANPIYNDLPLSVTHSNVLNFADDTKCYKAIKTNNKLLQDNLSSISSWSLIWKLNFNDTKFATVHFGRDVSMDNASYTMNNTSVQSSTCHKDLISIVLSNDLSWDKHHQHILAKAYGRLSLIRCSFSSSCLVSTKKALYVSPYYSTTRKSGDPCSSKKSTNCSNFRGGAPNMCWTTLALTTNQDLYLSTCSL